MILSKKEFLFLVLLLATLVSGLTVRYFEYKETITPILGKVSSKYIKCNNSETYCENKLYLKNEDSSRLITVSDSLFAKYEENKTYNFSQKFNWFTGIDQSYPYMYNTNRSYFKEIAISKSLFVGILYLFLMYGCIELALNNDRPINLESKKRKVLVN